MVPRLRILLIASLLAAPATGRAAVPRAVPEAVRGAMPERAGDPVIVPGGHRARPAARFDPVRSCATPAPGAASLVRAGAARRAGEPLPTPGSADVGDIAVVEDDGAFFYTHNSGNPKLDLQAVSRAFYRSHGDDYDALAIFLPSGMSDWLGSSTAFAASYLVKNDTGGLNLPLIDESAGMGSAGRLEELLTMNGLDRYLDDPNAVITAYGLGLSGEQAIGHEFAHRWAAYVLVESLGVATTDLLGRDFAHWNFFLDSDASVLDGCDWLEAAPDSFWIDRVQDHYGRLDRYLMGVLRPDEVGPMLLVTQPTALQPPGPWAANSIPTLGVTAHGVARWFTIDDVIAANGPRVPAAPDTVRQFRTAFVLALPRGAAASPGDLARLDSLRAGFVPWFETATMGRARMDTRLAPTPPRLVVEHTPLKDTEDTVDPRPVGARVRLVGGNLAVALDPASVRVRWRVSGDASFAELPMSSAGPDSFVALLPAVAGDVEYALAASTLPAVVNAALPLPSGATFHYHAGPDQVPPVVTHLPVPLQAPWRLPQTLLARVDDDLAVDSVWVEWSVDGGAAQVTPATPAGGDTFVVKLGAGIARGQRLAYRFVARDSAAVPNLGFSNPAFDTLVAARDLFEDFEQGAPFVHDAAVWSYRDDWHPEIDPLAPERGTGMHAGAADGGPYAPHLDAVLYTPFLYGIPDGAVLQFDHRYDLEDADEWYAYDGALLESSVGGAPWEELVPNDGYPLSLAAKVSTVPPFTPVWSGDSHGWRTEYVDLSSLAPGPAIVRWRMVTDEFIGRDGWRVDHVRITWPDGTMDVPLTATPAGVRVWPNPARGALSLAVPAGLTGEGAWELYDVAGRRVATLWRGHFGAPGATLRAAMPQQVTSGLYFARLTRGGRVISDTRVAVVR